MCKIAVAVVLLMFVVAGHATLLSQSAKKQMINIKIEIGGLNDDGVESVNACTEACKRDCEIRCGGNLLCVYLCYIGQCGCPGATVSNKVYDKEMKSYFIEKN